MVIIKSSEEIALMKKAREVPGTIRLLTQAPGFADLKMTREKGQSDLTAFQVRIYTEPVEGVIPGMTIGVKLR